MRVRVCLSASPCPRCVPAVNLLWLNDFLEKSSAPAPGVMPSRVHAVSTSCFYHFLKLASPETRSEVHSDPELLPRLLPRIAAQNCFPELLPRIDSQTLELQALEQKQANASKNKQKQAKSKQKQKQSKASKSKQKQPNASKSNKSKSKVNSVVFS